MSKASLPMHSGTLKEAPWQGTSFSLPTRMVVLMRCSYRPMAQATLMSMTLCVEPKSTNMRTPVPFITPSIYMREAP
jgi:hypothetical protein